MVGSKYTQASDLPSSDDIDCGSLKSHIDETCISDLDHLVQASASQNCALIDDFTGCDLYSWNESGYLTHSLAEGNLLDFDDFGNHGTGDRASIDSWHEALTANIDFLPKIQTDNPSFDRIPEPCSADLSMPSEGIPTDVSSYIAVPVTPSNSYQPTPYLTECSTPASFPASNDSHDSTIQKINNFDTDNQRWQATLSRSRTADRYFLYGVLTTKIFCRPSCASRRPSRKHVKFFPFPGAIEAAQQAKFRACKRCKPETLGTGNTAVLGILQVLRRIIAEIFEKEGEEGNRGLKLESLAKSAGLSTFHYHRLFKATTQVTPADFITACQALALQDELCSYSTRRTGLDPNAVQLASRWSQRTARKALGGLNPEEYANGARSASIEYCRVSSPVGEIEVAYSANKSISNVNVHAVVLLQDASQPISDHFGTSKRSVEFAPCLEQCVGELVEKCQDRDVELAADVLAVLWRARLWLKLTHDNVLR